MTTSETTALDPAQLERLAGRVGTQLDGAAGGPAAVAFACAKFNGAITVRLLDGALDLLAGRGVDLATVTVVWAPGAFELPLVARALAARAQAVVALGAVIRGDTPHFDYVAGQCATGLAQVALATGVPVVFGVLTCDTEEQALRRAGLGGDNKGAEAAATALEMVDVLGRLGPARS